jgi:hypothetical protein
VAVRIGSCKILRKQLLTAQPGPWEVYDLQHDEQEQHDLAATRPDLIRMAEQVLACEMTENPTFPMPLPGISKSDSSSTSP